MNKPKLATVLVFNAGGMGKADPALQLILANKYLRLINEADLLPNTICFYAEGVQLVIEGSPVLDVLGEMEEKGVRLIVCSTCLDFYGLREKLQVGIIGGMPDIIESQFQAEKVITL